MRRFYLIVGTALFLFAGWILWDGFLRPDSFDALPKGGDVLHEQVERNGETRDILVTDGVWHSVPFHEIVGGGPAKDGIPSIDEPKFLSVSVAGEDLDAGEPGIALSIAGVNRFYPYQILVWHEIVNDTINGNRVLITYCPLCATGIVFDPVVNGERVEFGTSGRLWQSNLLMYDRKTDSLWSQVLGEAVVGEMTGAELAVIPSDIVRFGEWAQAHPDGEVLSRDTGALRIYGSDPYGGYYTDDDSIFFPLRNTDARLQNKDLVFGVVVEGMAKAYAVDAIQDAGEAEDVFAGKTVVLRWDADLQTGQLFERNEDGSEKRMENVIPGYWFSWVAAYPETELWGE